MYSGSADASTSFAPADRHIIARPEINDACRSLDTIIALTGSARATASMISKSRGALQWKIVQAVSEMDIPTRYRPESLSTLPLTHRAATPPSWALATLHQSSASIRSSTSTFTGSSSLQLGLLEASYHEAQMCLSLDPERHRAAF